MTVIEASFAAFLFFVCEQLYFKMFNQIFRWS